MALDLRWKSFTSLRRIRDRPESAVDELCWSPIIEDDAASRSFASFGFQMTTVFSSPKFRVVFFRELGRRRSDQTRENRFAKMDIESSQEKRKEQRDSRRPWIQCWFGNGRRGRGGGRATGSAISTGQTNASGNGWRMNETERSRSGWGAPIGSGCGHCHANDLGPRWFFPIDKIDLHNSRQMKTNGRDPDVIGRSMDGTNVVGSVL